MTPVDVAAANHSFRDEPLIVRYEDGRNWVVYEPFTYVSPRVTIHIPKGFETDFASIPRVLWRWMPPTDGRIGKPAVIHDYIYRSPAVPFSRLQADHELREAMACVGASKFDRNVVYRAVRWFGGGSYKERNHA